MAYAENIPDREFMSCESEEDLGANLTSYIQLFA